MNCQLCSSKKPKGDFPLSLCVMSLCLTDRRMLGKLCDKCDKNYTYVMCVTSGIHVKVCDNCVTIV